MALLVVKFELLDERELLPNCEKVWVHLWVFGLSSHWVSELIVDRHRQTVVVVHRELLH